MFFQRFIEDGICLGHTSKFNEPASKHYRYRQFATCRDQTLKKQDGQFVLVGIPETPLLKGRPPLRREHGQEAVPAQELAPPELPVPGSRAGEAVPVAEASAPLATFQVPEWCSARGERFLSQT